MTKSRCGRDWPHAPVHRFNEYSAYMITGGTFDKKRLINTPAKLDLVQDLLFAWAREFSWMLQAWAVLANHYHFVALSSSKPDNLGVLIGRLHGRIGKELNALDGVKGRRVMYQYWDTEITYERSYLARLNYSHQNPVHHGVVKNASNYSWCSAPWFERTAQRSFVKTVYSFKTDRINVIDDF